MFTINMRWSDAIPQSLNRYSYVQNDPVNFTDPSGLLRWAGPEKRGPYNPGYRDADLGGDFGWLYDAIGSGGGEEFPGSGGSTPPPPNTQEPTPTPDPCANQILTDFSLRNESRTNPILPYIQSSVAQDFQNALDEINRAVPGGIGFTEVFRTRAIQQGLWDNRRNNTNPVARPGTSRHEGGFAFDVPGAAYKDSQGRIHQTELGRTIIPIFARHGFAWGGSFGDPPHFQADFRRGGYGSSADAATAANAYYENCIRGRR